MTPTAFYRRISDLIAENRAFCVATLVDSAGSVPQHVGTRMLIFPDGSLEATIGGGPFEAMVIVEGKERLVSGKSGCKHYGLTEEELGMYCAGTAQVFFEVFRPTAHLIVCGGGHVGQALAEFAGRLHQFFVTVVDDRPDFAERSRHLLADQVIKTDRAYLADFPSTGPQSLVVIATRCHETDYFLASRLIREETGFLGMLGSEAKMRRFAKSLREEGLSEEEIGRLVCPVGFGKKQKDPKAIAISILAQLLERV